MNKFTKQCVAAFASLAMAGTLCVAGAVAVNSSAWAVENQTAAKAPWDDTAKTGTITIHKQDDTTKEGIGGATFTAEKVKIIDGKAVDLTTRDGWDKLATLVDRLNKSATTEDNKIAYDTAQPKQTASEDGNGIKKGDAKFTGLSIGIYRIKETTPPTGYTSDVVPFFMTVPEITRDNKSTNNTYTYDVEVTPKNHDVRNAITKTADTKNMVGVGDVLPYTIDATPNKTKATNLKNGNATDLTADDLKQYAIFDDALKDAYSNATKDVDVEVKVDGVQNALTKGTDANDTTNDYYVTAAETPNDNTRTRISVVFLKKGLEKIVAKLNAVNGNNQPKVHVTFKFKIAATVPTGSDHKLMNKYGFIPGGNDGENHDPVVPTTHTDTEFRKFHIFKYDGKKGETAEGTKLKDAKFKVFAGATGDNTADAAALKVAQKCADDPTAANACDAALKGFEDSTKTYNKTNENGVTEDYTAKVGQKFYVVETQAPANYARSTKVYEVTLTTAKNNEGAQVVKIANVPVKDNGENWFKLPKTGAAGVAIFALAGMCLVAAGIFVFMRNRKKEEQEA